MSNNPCTFIVNREFQLLEADKKDENDFDANLAARFNHLGVTSSQDKEKVDATITSPNNNNILIGEFILTVNIDRNENLKIKKYNGGGSVCDNDRNINVEGLVAECKGGELKFDSSSSTQTFDLIPFLERAFNCPAATAPPTEPAPTEDPTPFPTSTPTKSPTILITDNPTLRPQTPGPTPGIEANLGEENESNLMMAVLSTGGGIFVLLLLCVALVAVRKRRKREEERDLFVADSPYVKKNETLVQVEGYNNAGGGFIDDRKLRDSMNKFDTTNFSRISGLSMLTTNTTNSEVTQQDFDNHLKIKSVVSEDKRKFAALSQMVAKQVDRLSMNTLELRNRDEDINERVLDKVVPFVKALLKPHQTKKTKMMKFNLKSAPRVSLKFYMSRLVMGLNGWFYEDEESNEIGLRCLFLALLYLDKLPEKVKGFEVTNLNVYKLLAIFMLIAAKFTEDDVITNTYWGDVCGYSAQEVNDLEALLCFQYGFSFVVDPEHLTKLFQLFNERELPAGLKSAGGSAYADIL